jgi:hypothetical protein
MNTDQLVGKYVELRGRRSTLKKDYETADDALKLVMGKIEDKLKEDLDASGQESARTAHGTVFKTYKEYANIADWDTVLAFIKKNDAFDMFEKRISKTAVRDRMQQDADGNYLNPPPPGVNFVRQEVVQIRRK